MKLLKEGDTAKIESVLTQWYEVYTSDRYTQVEPLEKILREAVGDE